MPMIILGALAIPLALVIWLLITWSSTPQYRVIYSGLSEAEGGAIIAELEKRAVPYQLSGGGQNILVPTKQVYSLRLQLAEQGLPHSGSVGLEVMEAQRFGTSQFTEQVNFQRGLEGELTRSIQSLGPVSKARVHLVMPKNSPFARDREKASASVVLHLQHGREIGDGQVSAIMHLVASSVPMLPVEKVTVVDQAGRLLSKPNRSSQDLDGEQLTYINNIEMNFAHRIEAILSPILGKDNLKAQVTAQIDFSKREETAERFGHNQPPNDAAIRSQQLSENYSGDADFARGVPGALSNSPPFNPGITDGTGGVAENEEEQANPNANGSLSRDRTVNYEVDRNVEHIQHRSGGVKRLSAAVVVNYRYDVDEEGEPVRVALTEDEMANIERLVRKAIGYSELRGDEVEIINSPFTETEEIAFEEEWWKDPYIQSLIISGLKMLVALIVILLIWFKIVRPLVRNQTSITEARKAALLAASQPALILDEQELEENVELGEGGLPTFRRKKPSYDHNLQGFRAMAAEDPRLVATVLHNWIVEK